MLAGDDARPVHLLLQRPQQHLAHERGLSGPADAGDADEAAERNRHVDALQVVLSRAQDLQPVVAGTDGVAVGAAGLAVHVVALVGGDEVVAGDGVVAEVGGQRRVVLVVGVAVGIGLRGRIAGDVLVEDEGVVLGVIEASAGDGTGAGGGGDPLLVGHPGHAVGGVLDLGDQVGGADGAVRRRRIAVGGEGVVGEGVGPRLHPDVVRLAGQAGQLVVEVG